MSSLEDVTPKIEFSTVEVSAGLESKSYDSSTSRRSKLTRPSASKKYPGQLMLGIAKLGLTLLQFSINPIDKLVIEIIMKDIVGKTKEEYKINTVEKVRNYFVIVPEDDELKRAIKLRFMALVVSFFQENNFNFWVNNVFKGTADNRDWYKWNKNLLMEKILQNRKVHFYMDAASNPFENGQLTVNDSEYEGVKKIKIEEMASNQIKQED